MFLKKIAPYCVFLLALSFFVSGPVYAVQDPLFTVQVETLSFEPAARAVVNRLRERGYDAFFETDISAGDKALYKVRFGRFATRVEALAAAKAYKVQEQRDCFVVQTMRKAALAAQTAAPRSAKPDPSVTAQSTDNGKDFYTVQIAAKEDSDVAQTFSDRLRRKGYPVYVHEPAPGDARPFYRIRFGRYETRAQAEQAGRSYAGQERGDYLVVLSPAENTHAAQAAVTALKALPEPGTSATAGPFFTVQVCVRESARAAERYADSLRAKGFNPYIVTYETTKGKILYRVRMGTFKERSRAVELARAYEQKGGRDFLVVRSEQLPLAKKNGASSHQPDTAGQASSPASEPVQGSLRPLSASDRRAGQDTSRDGTDSGAVEKVVAPAGAVVTPAAKKPAGQGVTVTKIYAYTGSGNELNLTNAYAKIPADLVARIQYVSIFPVMLLSVPEKGSALEMEVEGVRRLVQLAGLRLPEENRAVVSAGIQEVLSAESLRLKYHPDDDRTEMLRGTLYYRSGADLQIELLKRGLALVDEGNLPAARQDSLRAAQQRAQGLKAGIWSGQTP